MNAQHERNRDLRARLKSDGLLTDPIVAQLDVPWRHYGVPGQVAFFILASVAVGAFYFLLKELDVPMEGLITGVVAIVLAEILIARRWFLTGVESALWLCATYSMISELPSSGTPEAMLVLGAAAALPGWRLRNPLFGALAAIFLVLYAEKRFDLGVVCAAIITVLACVALLRTWQRPSTEWLWITLALVMPIAGRTHADEPWRNTTILLYAITGVVALMMAIARRHHALFLSAMIALAIAVGDVLAPLAWPDEAKLGLAGVLLLAVAFTVHRTLRDHQTGFVLTPTKLTPFDDEAALAATLVAQPHHHAAASEPAAETPAAGGGSFGGAGASGDY